MISRAKLKDKAVVIELPLQQPKVSTSGKSILIATTRGPLNTGIDCKGSDLFIVASAYTKNPKYNSPADSVKSKSRRTTGK